MTRILLVVVGYAAFTVQSNAEEPKTTDADRVVGIWEPVPKAKASADRFPCELLKDGKITAGSGKTKLTGTYKVTELNRSTVLEITWVSDGKALPTEKVFVQFPREEAMVWIPEDQWRGIYLNRKRVLRAEGGNSLEDVAISADGSVLAQIEDRMRVRIWDFRTGKLLRSWERGKDSSGALHHTALSPDGKLLAVAATSLYHGDILVYDTTNGKLVWHQKDATRSSWLELAFSPDGKRLVSTGNFIDAKDKESLLRVWDARDGTFQRELKGGTKNRDLPIPFAPDGKTVVALAGKDRLVFWDIETGKTDSEMRIPINDEEWIAAYAFAPDGKTLAIQCTKSLLLWDRPGAKVLRVLSDKGGIDRGLRFSADGAAVLGFDQDGLQAWDVKTGTTRMLLNVEYSGPRAFAPDGKQFASGYDIYRLPK